jgi:hypothetical protein
MIVRAALLAALFAAPVAAPVAAAQEGTPHDHSLGRLGRVSFPVSCTPEAQRRFEHAMAVLHSFWWEEGERAFGAVLASDPSCSMAHWGRALSAWGNPFAGGPTGAALTHGAEAARLASARPARTLREQGFLNAAAALYREAESTPNAARLQAYADTMARLHAGAPRDPEVTIYHALAMLATAPRTDTTFAQQRAAVALLDPLFARYPDHPGLAHYIIHSTDSPVMASHGLSAARRYSRIAPAAPHARHMPSHIFIRLALWDETVASNWQSYDAGMAHARTQGGEGPTGEELHALDYAVYAYLQQGRDSAARHAVATGWALPVRSSGSTLAGQYNRTAMAARVPLELGDWVAAATIPTPANSDAPVAAVLGRFTPPSGSPGRASRVKAGPRWRRSIHSCASWRPKSLTGRVWPASSGMRRVPGCSFSRATASVA